jgi:hypothetical protein
MTYLTARFETEAAASSCLPAVLIIQGLRFRV